MNRPPQVKPARAVHQLLVATVAVLVATSAVGVHAPVSATRSGSSAVPSSAPGSVTVHDRRITVPSGAHFYGSEFQVMTGDGAHVFVRSSSDLSVAPEDEVPSGTIKFFDLVAGRAVRVDCPGCHTVVGSSSDGSAVAAFSFDRLVGSDTDDSSDLYLFDGNGAHAVSSGAGGLPKFKAMADDGSFVLFSIRISLDPADTDTTEDLYRWNRNTGAIRLVSPGVHAPQFAAMSSDGERVLTQTGENILGIDLGDSGESGIYEWTAGATTLRGRGEFASVSDDWTRVYMGTALALDSVDQDEARDVYVHDAAGYRVLSEPSTGPVELAAVKADGSAWVLGTQERLTTADTDLAGDFYLVVGESRTLITRGSGTTNAIMMDAAFQTAIYSTRSRLDALDTDDWDDVYRWRANAPDAPQLLSGVGTPDVRPLAYALDGSRAFMTSSGRHLPEDTDDYIDIYEFVGGELRLPLPGTQNYDVWGWTGDLKRVVVSAGALTGEDTNGNVTDVYLSDADVDPPAVVLSAPTGTTGASTQAVFATPGGDGVWFDCRVDSAPWNRCSSPHDLAGLAAGTHQFDLRAFDAAGNVAAASASWLVAETAPTAAPPSYSLISDVTLARKPKVRISWPAASDDQGISSYRLERRVDAGSWTNVSLPAPTARSVDVGLAAGTSTYTFRVRALDASGNSSTWAVGPTFGLSRLQEKSSAIRYTGTFTRVALNGASGGYVKKGAAVGSAATLTFSGRSVAFVTTLGPKRGKASIKLDGVTLATLDLYAATARKAWVTFVTPAGTGSHTLSVTILGTKNAASGGTRVDIDAFVVLR